jgi:hypothetical protein
VQPGTSLHHPVGGTTQPHPRIPLGRYEPHTQIPHMRKLTTRKHARYEPHELDAADQADGRAGEGGLVVEEDVDLADCRGGWGGAVVRPEPRGC